MNHEQLRRTQGLSILYIGAGGGTSLHRAASLKRLGHRVFHVDPGAVVPSHRFVAAWEWHTGCLFMEEFIRQQILASIPRLDFDLVYVDSGDLIGPSLVRDLKKRFGRIINYNMDDPFGKRDGRRWRLYLKSVALYDLVVVVRDCNVDEALGRGAKRVLRVSRGADEIAHSPRVLHREDYDKWAAEVSFVGTWMPERGMFMSELVRRGVPLSIYGDHWQKAAEWPRLQHSWRGPGLYDDCSYAKAIQCAKVNLGLLSKGNRDLTTTRSFEIPYLGGVFCAERTPEHTHLYREGEEAMFWESPEECAAKCKTLLQDKSLRDKIAANGRQRCRLNGTTNEQTSSQIIEEAFA